MCRPKQDASIDTMWQSTINGVGRAQFHLTPEACYRPGYPCSLKMPCAQAGNHQEFRTQNTIEEDSAHVAELAPKDQVFVNVGALVVAKFADVYAYVVATVALLHNIFTTNKGALEPVKAVCFVQTSLDYSVHL